MPPVTTAKAYASALCTGVAAALSAVLPFVGDSGLSVVITVALAVLAAYGITYAVPNAPTAQSTGRRRRNAVDELLGEVTGEPPA